MTKEEIIEAISEDKMMPFIQPEQLAGIVDFVIKNYQSSLPSNLDEAALKELQVYLPQGNGPDGICYFIAPQMLAMYNAGAEWMAGQGKTKEAVIGMATEEISISVSEQTLDELDLCPGDKVVVQIRKK